MPRSRSEEIKRRATVLFVLACLIGTSAVVGCGREGKPHGGVLEDSAFSQTLVELSSTPAGVSRMPKIRWSHVDPTTALVAPNRNIVTAMIDDSRPRGWICIAYGDRAYREP